MDRETKSTVFRYGSVAANVIYRLLILAALLWIGYELRDVADAIDAAASNTQDADASGDAADGQDSPPQVIRPLMRERI